MMEDEVAELQRKLDESFERFAGEKKDLKVQHDRLIQEERAKVGTLLCHFLPHTTPDIRWK